MLKKFFCSIIFTVLTLFLYYHGISLADSVWITEDSAKTPEGTQWVSGHGYSGCIRLSNKNTVVILEPNCGGRVLEYSLNGKNALFIDTEQDGWTYTPGKKGFDPSGGRFDIGPETTAPRHPDLWIGRWKAEIVGKRAARLISIEDKATGVQLIREFTLDSNSSHLRCIQTIKNISDTTKQYFHWSRTFAEGNGICLVPLTPGSRFPQSYIIYGPGPVMNFNPPVHPNVRVRDGFLEITGTPPQPKFGLDSSAGWLAYITRRNLLFVKRFSVYPERVYGEMAALTISIWYYKEKVCELEPIGPREIIKPGKSASFTEDWWLLPYDFPQEGKSVDLDAFKKFVMKNTR